jgi:hypothetical protein
MLREILLKGDVGCAANIRLRRVKKFRREGDLAEALSISILLTNPQELIVFPKASSA